VRQPRIVAEPERGMVISLPSHLESALAAQARHRGIAPEDLALTVLSRHLLPATPPVPADEWERKLFGIAVDCGVSVPDAALSSDGLYE
jgi:hypothetical protein